MIGRFPGGCAPAGRQRHAGPLPAHRDIAGRLRLAEPVGGTLQQAFVHQVQVLAD
ncbi:MAG TPA: hypothetical protein VH641_00275 [Streptosporangiaceae bacterium]